MTGFKAEIENNILPFWLHRMRDEHQGGYYGKMTGTNRLVPEANKGLVLNARLLWTFSAAYRILKKEEYRLAADRAFEYLTTRFYDRNHAGFYWELDYRGQVFNRKKQTYAQAFALYGLSEYYRATQQEKALELAQETFAVMEKYADPKYGGYFEAFSANWQPLEDMRLSEKDFNEKKSMNTHLHVLEAYTSLLRVWPNPELKTAHRALLKIFMQHIVEAKTARFHLFFGEDWTPRSTLISYGHDIEGSWLLLEAAQVSGEFLQEIQALSIRMARAALDGLQPDGSTVYEKEDGHTDMERHWWVQAEAVVGYSYAWKNSGDPLYKTAAEKAWNYILENIVDTRNGEWYWSRLPDGTVNTKEDKAGFWKCPYHNGRMCLEMMEHFGEE